MSSLMSVSFAPVSTVPPVLSVTAEQTAIVALVVAGACFWALVALDRTRFRLVRRPVPVKVEQLETPLHHEPVKQERIRAAGTLGAGAVLLGALVACIVGMAVAIGLQVVGGLLG